MTRNYIKVLGSGQNVNHPLSGGLNLLGSQLGIDSTKTKGNKCRYFGPVVFFALPSTLHVCDYA